MDSTLSAQLQTVPLELPSTKHRWMNRREHQKLLGKTIFDVGDYKSGSKIDFNQYLLLRILWKPEDRDDIFSSLSRYNWFEKKCFQDAKLHFDSKASAYGWQLYLKSIKDNLPRLQDVYPPLGSFFLVRYFQQAVSSLEGTAEDSPKTRFYNTRSKGGLPSPSTSTPSTQPLASSPDNSVNSLFADISSLGIGSPSIITESSLFISPNPKQDPGYDQPEPPTEDEQIVNMALVAFLNAITVHLVRDVEWSLKRESFFVQQEGVRVFEARVDGVLRRRSNRKTVLAILEVKPYKRVASPKVTASIRMQEAAQMACWISSQPNSLQTEKAKQGKPQRYVIN